MKFYVISDNTDTYIGMRLAGMPGEVIDTAKQAELALLREVKNAETAMILVTEKTAAMLGDTLHEIKIKYAKPLIVEIPDRHGTQRTTDSITQYVQKAIGMKI